MKWNNKKNIFEDVVLPKKKRKKRKKKLNFYKGKIDSNWSNVSRILLKNKINFATTPDDNPLFFFIFDGKAVTADKAKTLIVSECDNIIVWV